MLKKQYIQILTVIIVCIVFHWAINNFNVIMSFVNKFFKVMWPLILGGAIAFTVDLPMKWIEIRIENIAARFNKTLSVKAKRAISLPLSAVFILGVFTSLIVFIIPEVTKTIISFLDLLPGYLKTLEGYIAQISASLSDYELVVPQFNLTKEQLTPVINFLTDFGHVFIDNTLDVTMSFFGALMNFFMACTFAVYLLLEKEKVKAITRKSVAAIFPEKTASYLTTIVKRSDTAFSNFISGQLIESGILGVLCFIGMKIFNFPQPLLISVIISVTALIPVFGPWIGAFLGSFIILLTVPGKVIWFIIFIIVLQQLETNIIYPRVVGKKVGIPGILVLASVTVGGNLFGMLGMILSVPVVSVLYGMYKEFIDALYKKRHNK